MDRARSDPDVSHGLQGEALEAHITGMLRGLDVIYGKMLGLRWSEQFASAVAPPQGKA